MIRTLATLHDDKADNVGKERNTRDAAKIQKERQRKEEETVKGFEEALEEALKRHKSLMKEQKSDDEKVLASLLELRDCYENLGYWDQALGVEQEFGKLLAVDNVKGRAENLYRQGKLLTRLEKMVSAGRYYRQALDLYDEIYSQTYHADKGNVLVSVAGIHFHRGRYRESLAQLEDAEPHFRGHGADAMGSSDVDASSNNAPPPPPHPDLIKCLQQQGLLHRSSENFVEARKCYQEALDVLEALPADIATTVSHEKRQALLLDLADMLTACENYDRAVEVYNQILREDRIHTGSDEETALDGVILHNLGKIYARRKDYSAALESLRLARDIKECFAGEMHPEVAKTLDALGAVCAVTEDNRQEALQCFHQSLLIARLHAGEGETDPQVMLALRNIAILKGEAVPKWGSE